MNYLSDSMNDQRVINTRQLADLLNVSVATVRRLDRDRKLPPAVKLSERRIGWRMAEVQRWIASRQTAAA